MKLHFYPRHSLLDSFEDQSKAVNTVALLAGAMALSLFVYSVYFRTPFSGTAEIATLHYNSNPMISTHLGGREYLNGKEVFNLPKVEVTPTQADLHSAGLSSEEVAQLSPKPHNAVMAENRTTQRMAYR